MGIKLPSNKVTFATFTKSEDTPNEHRRLGGWLHLSRNCSSLLRGEHIVASSVNCAPPNGHSEPQPKREGKDAIKDAERSVTPR